MCGILSCARGGIEKRRCVMRKGEDVDVYVGGERRRCFVEIGDVDVETKKCDVKK
jgi:hypothetical protein